MSLFEQLRYECSALWWMLYFGVSIGKISLSPIFDSLQFNQKCFIWNEPPIRLIGLKCFNYRITAKFIDVNGMNGRSEHFDWRIAHIRHNVMATREKLTALSSRWNWLIAGINTALSRPAADRPFPLVTLSSSLNPFVKAVGYHNTRVWFPVRWKLFFNLIYLKNVADLILIDYSIPQPMIQFFFQE